MAEFHVALPNVSTGLIDMSTDIILSPRPSTVDYGEPQQVRHETISGPLVVQSPLVDNRPKTWQWDGPYPDWQTGYQALWTSIQTLRSRYRLTAGLYAHVFLKEDVTALFRTIAISTSTSSATVTPTYGYLKVRVIEVSRVLNQQGSSLVRYGPTKLVFTIDDASYNDLG